MDLLKVAENVRILALLHSATSVNYGGKNYNYIAVQTTYEWHILNNINNIVKI